MIGKVFILIVSFDNFIQSKVATFHVCIMYVYLFKLRELLKGRDIRRIQQRRKKEMLNVLQIRKRKQIVW